MNHTVVMYLEIGCFVCCLYGWILNCSTLATEYWNFSEVNQDVLTTINFFSNLWMDCVSDTTGASDCKYYASMMGLPVFLHVCRALAVVSVILGFWGAVLALIGMKCTKIGGSELANARVTFAAALTYMASGFSGMIVYSMWGQRTRSQFVDQNYMAQKFEIGAAVFVGWGGSSLIIVGSAVMCYLSVRQGLCSNSNKSQQWSYVYMRSPSKDSSITARTRGTYRIPASSKHTTVIMSPLLESGRDSKRTRTQNTQRTYTNRTARVPVSLNIDSYV
ncbi:claudin-10 [Brachyhypopomus gauderio]|uniref:claudin-10 n=1 Tax=Brachyhypopomus gauderio TaxID=698409 RepID=UPI0040437DC3